MSNSESELKCTEYTKECYPELPFIPCQCPVCGGFLKWIDETKPICNKCGAELIAIPYRDEETGQELGEGKICPLSLKKKVVKRERL